MLILLCCFLKFIDKPGLKYKTNFLLSDDNHVAIISSAAVLNVITKSTNNEKAKRDL
jgi:hypothetical protein